MATELSDLFFQKHDLGSYSMCRVAKLTEAEIVALLEKKTQVIINLKQTETFIQNSRCLFHEIPGEMEHGHNSKRKCFWLALENDCFVIFRNK